MPTGQLFGIVGVNGGLASTENPCLKDELSWANGSGGGTSQTKIQLYLNTGNPGDVTPKVATWPTNNTDPKGTTTSNPYGTCDGSNSAACAWQYGWNHAVTDVQDYFKPEASNAGISQDPSAYPWWLDVETTNSWESGSGDALTRNQADLEGMVAYLKSLGITPGVYSTSLQWGEIVGSPSSSSLIGLNSWLPGASDLSNAKSKCSAGGLTSGSKVILTQWSTSEFDFDYSCQ